MAGWRYIMTAMNSDASPGTLNRVTLVRLPSGRIRLTIVDAGRSVYWEDFGGWDTALTMAPRLVRDRAWEEIILEVEHGDR
jgi:hypothetical protein